MATYAIGTVGSFGIEMAAKDLVVVVAFMFLFSLPCRHARCRAFAFTSRPRAIYSRQTQTSLKRPYDGYGVSAFTEYRVRMQPFLTRVYSSAARDTDSSMLLEGLNEAQVEAVTQPLSSITRVVAGPGAGKTRVLTSRIAYLLHHDEEDRRILAVTFTKKAAGEMQHRLEKLLETTTIESTEQPLQQNSVPAENNIVQEEVADAESSTRRSTALDRVTLGTFHSVCAKILRWNGKHLSALPSVVQDMMGVANATTLDGSFAIIDQADQVRLLKECTAELEIDLKSQDLKPQTVLNALAKIKSNRATGIDPSKSGRKVPSKTMRVGEKVYPLYRQKLLTRNALDFDDLILMTRELLSVHDDIRDHLRRRWQHVLVDEFQDTSQSQSDLVKLLSSDSLLVVGDADQSIYSWRGAHAESMSDFLHEFSDRLNGVNTVHLMENYRSTTNIVNAAQKIISSDSKSSKQADLRQDMKPMRGVGPQPRVLACADAKAEASFVVQTIQDSIASGDYTPDCTVAIIYRTNAQSRAIEEACVQANLPYVIRGSSGAFYKRAEIQDCLCFLRLLRNGRDEAAMKRAIKTPSRGIGDVAYQEFDSYCQKIEEFYRSNYPDRAVPTPFDVLISLTDDGNKSDSTCIVQEAPSPTEFISKRALNRFIPFSKQMRLIRSKAQTLTVAGLMSSIIVNLELRSHVDAISKSSSEFSDRWSNVIELRRAAQKYSDDGASLTSLQEGDDDEDQPAETPLTNFLDDVALVTDMADDATDPNGAEKRLVVNLMTIHASKGMEFDGVFLIGNEDGTLPTKLAIMEGEGSVALDEEKRLCYVAMTRAKTHLVMTWRREVSVFTGNTFTTMNPSRSRFLDILVGKSGEKTKASKNGTRTRGDSSSGKRSQPTIDNKMTSRRSIGSRPSILRVQGGRLLVQVAAAPSLALGHANGTRRDMSTASPTRIRKTNQLQPPRQTQVGVSRTGGSPSRKKEPHEIQVRATLGKSSPLAAKGRNGSTQTTNSPKTENRKKSDSPLGSESMDSTWFYPIGSSVVHTQHGSGTVLPPPSSKQMLVRVQFENGSKQDFPADGKDLHLY